VDPTVSNHSGSALQDDKVTGMAGAGKRNSVARNSVGSLVMVESIIFKRLSTRVGGWWNTVTTTIPVVLH